MSDIIKQISIKYTTLQALGFVTYLAIFHIAYQCAHVVYCFLRLEI